VVSTPLKIDEIADEHKLVSPPVGKGYTEVDTAAIIGEN